MVQPQRSQRVVIALALAGRGADLRDAQFRKAYDRIAGEPEGIRFGLRGAFRVYLDIKPLRSAPKPRLPHRRKALGSDPARRSVHGLAERRAGAVHGVYGALRRRTAGSANRGAPMTQSGAQTPWVRDALLALWWT